MKPGNMYNVRQALEKIRFGIVKMINSAFVKDPVSFMIETLVLTDDGHLWCTATGLPAECIQSNKFPVKLSYIQKGQGLFIKLAGRAEIVENDLQSNDPIKRKLSTGQTQMLIRVRIEEAQGYQKQSTSPHTSYLQSINHFTIGRQAS